jgi:hypothetical protein
MPVFSNRTSRLLQLMMPVFNNRHHKLSAQHRTKMSVCSTWTNQRLARRPYCCESLYFPIYPVVHTTRIIRKNSWTLKLQPTVHMHISLCLSTYILCISQFLYPFVCGSVCLYSSCLCIPLSSLSLYPPVSVSLYSILAHMPSTCILLYPRRYVDIIQHLSCSRFGYEIVDLPQDRRTSINGGSRRGSLDRGSLRQEGLVITVGQGPTVRAHSCRGALSVLLDRGSLRQGDLVKTVGC